MLQGHSSHTKKHDVSILFFLMRRFCLGNGPPNLHVAARWSRPSPWSLPFEEVSSGLTGGEVLLRSSALKPFRGFRLFLGAASLGCPGPLDLRVASPVEKMVRYFALAARGGQPRPRSRDSPAAPSTALHVPACSPERHPRRAAGLS